MTSESQKEVFRKVSHSIVGIDNPIFEIHGMRQIFLYKNIAEGNRWYFSKSSMNMLWLSKIRLFIIFFPEGKLLL